MNQKNKSGYILVLTLIMMALATAIVTRLFYQGSAFLPLANLAIERQKAKNLALGGVQLALSKLNSLPKVDLDEQKKAPKKSKEQQFLMQVLPIINQWEVVNLNQEVDGIDGKIQFCLSCENGKINLNQLYDFNQHIFSDLNVQKKDSNLQDKVKKTSGHEEALRLLLMQIGKITKQEEDFKNALDALISFLSKRKYQLLDVTELLEIPAFAYFKTHVFCEPPKLNDQDRDSYVQKSIYLTDLFTVSTASSKLEPWLLSDSMITILDFPKAGASDIMKRTAAVNEWVKEFKVNSQWQTAWDKTAGLMYGVNFNAVPKPAVNLFENKFNPKFFSVLSYGTVGNITQKVCAIIKSQTQGKTASFVVEKLYSI